MDNRWQVAPLQRLRLAFVDELCKFGELRDDRVRAAFLDKTARLAGVRPPAVTPSSRVDLGVLTDTILPDDDSALAERGRNALISTVRQYIGSDEAQALDQRVETAFTAPTDAPSPPTPILDDIGDELRDAAVRLLRETGSPAHPHLRDQLLHELNLDLPRVPPEELFLHLLEFNAQPDGLPPAVVLMELLAATVSSPTTGSRLRSWSTRWAGRHPAPTMRQALEARRQAVQHRRPSPHDAPRCLTIMIDPADDGSRDLFVRHWVNPVSGYWDPRPGDPVRTSEENMEPVVRRALARAGEEWLDADPYSDDSSPVHVEFVVPHELLGYDFAGIRTSVGGNPEKPISMRYFVHLRSLERMRMRDGEQRMLWRARWKAHRRGPVVRSHTWRCDTETYGVNEWHLRLIADETICAVALNAPAAPGHALAPLKLAVGQGIGIALWHNETDPPEHRAGQLLMTIGRPAAQLPQAVKALRVAAAIADSSAGGPTASEAGFFSFLFDDPFRLVDCE
jgi:hypothetical protein